MGWANGARYGQVEGTRGERGDAQGGGGSRGAGQGTVSNADDLPSSGVPPRTRQDTRYVLFFIFTSVPVDEMGTWGLGIPTILIDATPETSPPRTLASRDITSPRSDHGWRMYSEHDSMSPTPSVRILLPSPDLVARERFAGGEGRRRASNVSMLSVDMGQGMYWYVWRGSLSEGCHRIAHSPISFLYLQDGEQGQLTRRPEWCPFPDDATFWR
jgi:hypothetical protein